MKHRTAFVFGFLAMFPFVIFAWFVALAGIAQEADNRAASALRAQWNIDKMHMLKIPEIHKRNRTQECQLSDSEIRCRVFPGGEMKIAVAK